MPRLGVLVASGLLALPAVTAQALFPDCQNGPELLRTNAVCDTSLPAEERAKAIIAAMTTAEKLNQTGSTSSGGVSRPAQGVARLGIPAYQWWSEALHGVARSPGVRFATSGNFSSATSFPEPITMGAAFDDELISAVAAIVSTEARAFNNDNRAGLDYWTPNINPYKDPRWGRGMETPGEDPFHLSSYVKHLLRGLEDGSDPSLKKVVATCKHYAAYDLEDWNGNDRMRFNAEVSTQDLVEYYLPVFRQCARDSKVSSIMCSYNAVNGVPACADPYLLQTVLREHWKWDAPEQYVTSDCDAILNVAPPWHNYTDTPEEAVAVSLNAGTDLDCGLYYPQHLPAALEQGLFEEKTLDKALGRMYTALVRLGYFDPPTSVYRKIGWGDVNTPEAKELAYTAASEGVVLLKNNGLLPLSLGGNGTNGTGYPTNQKISSLAVVGDWANATTQMQGNYYGVAPYLRSPLLAAQSLGVKVNYGAGPSQQNTSTSWPSLFAAANASDAIIYVGGVDIFTEAEGMDRNTISWTSQQLSVLEQLASLGKPFVVVQMGDQLDSTPLYENDGVDAVLWGGYPGQSGGDAIINIITGKTAPAGRLPVTQYPASYVDEIPMTDMSLRPSEGRPGRTYKWYDDAVKEFGFGLHYSNFSLKLGEIGSSKQIGRLSEECKEEYVDLCPLADVSVTVTNEGQVKSDYVVLLFVAGKKGEGSEPKKELVGYQRLKGIVPGETKSANIALTLGSFGTVQENGDRVLSPGVYQLLVDVPVQDETKIELIGEEAVLEKWPENPHKQGKGQ